MLVVAGAGTGKTTVLTERIARLVEQQHARPNEILALTYADDAALEMRERVAAKLGLDSADLQAHTFHAYCFGLLARAGKDFKVLDEQDLWIHLRRHISELGLKHFIKAANVGEFLRDLLQFFSRCHDELKSPEDFRGHIESAIAGKWPLPRVVKSKALEQTPRDEIIARCREVAGVYEKVERMLAAGGYGTFGHQITGAVRLLRTDPERLREERARARFILVDEFQDANLALIELVQLLAGEDANVFAVGDPDQAIYRFRGATAGAFEQFLARFPVAKGLTLEENQRSTSGILRSAFSVISKNPRITRPGRGIAAEFERHLLRSAREERAAAAGEPLAPEPVNLVYAPPQEQEGGDDIATAEVQAAEVAASIDDLHQRHGLPWSDFAVLYRINSHRNELAEELAARDIPFVVRGLDVLDVPEVRDLVAILRVLDDPGDSISLLRVAALPQFRIDPHELRRGLRAAHRDASMTEVLRGVPRGPEVIAALEQARATAAARKWKLLDVLSTLIKQFRLRRGSRAIDALVKFARTWAEKPITSKGTISEFIEYLDYFVEARGAVPLTMPDGGQAIQLMTVHTAKGLEFPRVFILRANSASFPLNYREPLFEFPPELREVRVAADSDPRQLHGEEERRLFYVAMTRARDSLTICARPTSKGNAPTGFVSDLIGDRALREVLVSREARAYRLTLAAGASEAATSAAASWMTLPPRPELLQEALSASAIETYNTCPLRFKIQRDWRLPEEPVAAMQFGSVMHSVLRNYYEAQRTGRPQSDDEVIAVFHTLLEQAKIADEKQRDLYREDGVRELREFLALRRAEPPVDVVATEKSFQIEIGAARVVGRMDRIDRLEGDRVAIVDYKTGSPRDQEDADESLQLSIYALAAERALKLVPERLVLYNLQTNQAVETSRTPAELLKAENDVRKVADGIARAEFPPRPNPLVCRHCTYRELCPATEERLFDLQELANPAGVN